MKVMTFNTWNYQRPWTERKKIIASLIRTHAPDVVGLQETRHDFRFERGRGQGEQLAELTGYTPTSAVAHVYVPILRVDEGLTILTRQPPLRSMLLQLTRNPKLRHDDNFRICLGVAVPVPGGELHVYNAHFSLSGQARISNAREVHAFVQEQSGNTPALFMGDLNAEPDETAIRFLMGAEPVDGVTADFIDCWTAAQPGTAGYTYSSDRPSKRIDYILCHKLPVAPASAETVGSEPVGSVFASDHLGIVVTLPFPGEQPV